MSASARIGVVKTGVAHGPRYSQRARVSGMRTVAVEFTMTPEQRVGLQALARERGLAVQELLELTVFGELRPRERARRTPRGQGGGEELPLSA